MAKLQWTKDLEVGVDDIDNDHRITIDQLNKLSKTLDDHDFITLFLAFADHLRSHFALEEGLMTKHLFFAIDCHTDEHKRVLDEIDGILKQLEAGDTGTARNYVDVEFPEWFMVHRATMDTVTARFLAQAIA